MASDSQVAIAAVLDRMWKQYLPLIHERVDTLEHAAQALAAASLTEEHQLQARSAAHKLAGILGTFGLARGTDLARELEVAYSRQFKPGPDPDLAVRLKDIAAEIRTIVASRS